MRARMSQAAGDGTIIQFEPDTYLPAEFDRAFHQISGILAALQLDLGPGHQITGIVAKVGKRPDGTPDSTPTLGAPNGNGDGAPDGNGDHPPAGDGTIVVVEEGNGSDSEPS